MIRIALAAAALLIAAAPVQARGELYAEKGAWVLGMFVGEGAGHPYPFVVRLQDKSDAKIRGVRPGDEIMRIDGDDSRPFKRHFERLSRFKPGRMVEIWVRRGSQTMKFDLRIPKGKPGESASKDEGKKAKPETPAPPVEVKPIPPPQ